MLIAQERERGMIGPLTSLWYKCSRPRETLEVRWTVSIKGVGLVKDHKDGALSVISTL